MTCYKFGCDCAYCKMQASEDKKKICKTCNGFGSVIVKVNHPTKGNIRHEQMCGDCGGSGVKSER